MAGENGGLIGPYNPSSQVLGAGCWRPSLIAQRLRSSVFGFPTGIADPNYASVVALYQMQELVFSSPGSIGAKDTKGGYTLTNATSVMNLYTVPKWGLYSLFCGTNVGGSKISGASAASAWNFSTNEWCIDFWINFNSVGTSQVVIDLRALSGAAINAPLIYFTSANKLNYFFNGSDRITGSTTVTTATWYYGAVARVSGVTRAYLGTSGTAAQEGSNFTDSNTYVAPGTGAIVGADINQNAETVQGYIGALRVTNGSGRGFSGASITVPTAPFPAY